MKNSIFLRTASILSMLFALCQMGSAQVPDYIPPDHKQETHAPNISFFPNVGQVTTTADESADNVLFASYGNTLHLFACKEQQLSFVLFDPTLDSTAQDTGYHVVMRLTGEAVNSTCVPKPLEPTSWYHNYYLPGCPQGQVQVGGYHRLLYKDV